MDSCNFIHHAAKYSVLSVSNSLVINFCSFAAISKKSEKIVEMSLMLLLCYVTTNLGKT